MEYQAWVTLGVLSLVLAMLVCTRRSPDVIMFGGLGLLLIMPVPGDDGTWRAGVIGPADAFAGFANEGVITIAMLFVVATGLRETGGLNWVVARMLGNPKNLVGAQARIMGPTALMSAFMNNTPLVAMLLPVVDDWARKHRISPSKLLMPLSFASILGGACTLIGTSTNLIVHGWLLDEANLPGLGMFELTWIGLPCLAVGIGFTLLAARWLLPDRVPVFGEQADARQYTVEMLVEPGSPLVDQTIEAAGLRHLPGLYLIEIERDQQVLPAVSSNVKLCASDRLVFAGIVESVVDLQKIRGLVPATNQVFKIDEPRTNRTLIEAVVSNTCPLVGMTIREGRFRTVYNAAVIAVSRNGERIRRKIGDIRLQPGDTLLLEARANFAQQQRNSRDFYLVSSVDNSRPLRHERAGAALAILAVMVVIVSLGALSMVQASMLAAGLMIFARCCSATDARKSIDWQVLLVIAAALGLGKAMSHSGLAYVLGHGLLAGLHDPHFALGVVFILTAVLAAVITAKAAAVLVLPIALATSADLGVSFMPFAIAVTIAAATSLATPIGYPTNLMVFGPGGYRFSDYVRLGLPLTIFIAGLCIGIIPLIWPFV